jgi:hypothetical protein
MTTCSYGRAAAARTAAGDAHVGKETGGEDDACHDPRSAKPVDLRGHR